MAIIDVYKSTFKFTEGVGFKWSPSNNTIYYDSINSVSSPMSLLHEIAHGMIGHENYDFDIDLIRLERDAWSRTKELAITHSVNYSDDYAQDCLETYRTWLHSRSLCPDCGQSGLESEPQAYSCFNCSSRWKVSKNQACQIQRRRTENSTSS